MQIKVSNPDELIAAVPHLVGFAVTDSLLVLPVSAGTPLARVDLPRTEQERADVVQAVMSPYERLGGGAVMVLGYSDYPDQVERASEQLRDHLEAAGVTVASRLWVGERWWRELDTGEAGERTPEASGRIDAEMVLAGHQMPARSREAVSRGFLGDPGPVERELHAATGTLERNGPVVERQWAVARAERFTRDGQTLSTPEAARMLVCVQLDAVRDQLFARIGTDTAQAWAPLWSDLTRRAPEQLVAPAATLAALASWCKGDGASAWCALDRIPKTQHHPMADLVGRALQAGMHPREWDHTRDAIAAAIPAEGMSTESRDQVNHLHPAVPPGGPSVSSLSTGRDGPPR